jgi:hypothetical protein
MFPNPADEEEQDEGDRLFASVDFDAQPTGRQPLIRFESSAVSRSASSAASWRAVSFDMR